MTGVARSEVLFNNLEEHFPLEDATRGAAAIPGLFPPRKCVIQGRLLRLVDGGVTNCVPVEKLFEPPFTPEQILVVDISNQGWLREKTRRKVEALEARHAEVPIIVVSPETIRQAHGAVSSPRPAEID